MFFLHAPDELISMYYPVEEEQKDFLMSLGYPPAYQEMGVWYYPEDKYNILFS